MAYTMTEAFQRNFLGQSPQWYKMTILCFLVVNPLLLAALGPVIAGWALVGEFIFTLAMALKCYPLQPGGLLAIESLAIGLTDIEMVYAEITGGGLQVILLLVFMVAGIYFLKDLLLFTFTRLVLGVRSKVVLSLWFSFVAAVLSAFLDALTVTAVVITVGAGFYQIYHKVASGKQFHHDHDHGNDALVQDTHRSDLEEFRAFLRQLLMHAAVGTALGGVMTIVGEPQNLLIGDKLGWEFQEFFMRMVPVTMPVFGAGLLTCFFIERFKMFGYGAQLPRVVHAVLTEYETAEDAKRGPRDKAALVSQALVVVFLVLALGFHIAPVGLIGLAVIVLATSFTGVTEEHRIGRAFEEALPFTSLLVVFFVIVAVIEKQHLFNPIIEWVLLQDEGAQVPLFYLANGVLSMISDNVFVATVYINSVAESFAKGEISRAQFDALAVAINTGTNIPSVATPNGQAAFLFLLTSGLAPLIRLSYGRMLLLALPYTIVMTSIGLMAVVYILPNWQH